MSARSEVRLRAVSDTDQGTSTGRRRLVTGAAATSAASMAKALAPAGAPLLAVTLRKQPSHKP